MDKREVASVLEEIGTLLELQGENPFKCRAYANAARAIASLEEDLEAVVRSGRISEVKGIGSALAGKIETLVTTGRLPYHEELKASLPAGLTALLRLDGLGPKRARLVWQGLGVTTLEELERACRENRIAGLPGFGARSQERLLQGLDRLRVVAGQFLYSDAAREAARLLELLARRPEVLRAEVGGSLRRRKEVIRDLDFVVASRDPAATAEAFAAHPSAAEVIARGPTKVSLRTRAGLQADLRLVTEEEFPSALLYFTGSKEHNVALRGRAIRLGMKLNEYGLFRGEERVAARDEEAFYRALGLAYIPPELREDRGEVEAAAHGGLPALVERGDLQGVFHVHTDWSDGKATLEEMARAAGALGLRYLGISDHSRSAAYAGGLSIEQVGEQMRAIDRLQERFPRLRLLKGIEADILADGSLDYPDDVLERFDFVVASVHGRMNLSEAEMTARVVRAVANPHVTFLGHPTGRLLLAREPYALDLAAVLRAAAQAGVAVEINADPHRLDLDWRHVREARDLGIPIGINPDAHDPAALSYLDYGVGIARKGWLRKEDVVNAWPLERVLGFLERARA
jgi:DNA polymerase (family 10)